MLKISPYWDAKRAERAAWREAVFREPRDEREASMVLVEAAARRLIGSLPYNMPECTFRVRRGLAGDLYWELTACGLTRSGALEDLDPKG